MPAIAIATTQNGSIDILRDGDHCAICLRGYNSTYFDYYGCAWNSDRAKKMSKELRCVAANLHSNTFVPLDEDVFCNHHFCQDCIEEMLETATEAAWMSRDSYSDEEDEEVEVVAVKCPLCRCEYVFDKDAEQFQETNLPTFSREEIRADTKTLKKLVALREKETRVNAILEVIASIEAIGAM